jgi:hypothetical protein
MPILAKRCYVVILLATGEERNHESGESGESGREWTADDADFTDLEREPLPPLCVIRGIRVIRGSYCPEIRRKSAPDCSLSITRQAAANPGHPGPRNG